MGLIERYEEAKRQLDAFKEQDQRLSFEIEAELKSLKESEGVADLAAAESLLVKLEKRKDALQKELTNVLGKLEEEWRARLDELEEEDE